MVRVIETTFVVNISFGIRKALNKMRKEKLKDLFIGYVFQNDKEVIKINNGENKIVLNGENVIISSKSYEEASSFIIGVFDIFDIDLKSKQYSLEISIKSLINNDLKKWTPLEESKIIGNFFDLKSQENKIVSSIEYITFMESEKEDLVTISLKMYNEGIVAKALIIIESIDKINEYFENLSLKLNASAIEPLLEKIGDQK